MESTISRDLTLLICLIIFILFQVFPLPSALRVWRPEFVLLLAVYITFRHLTTFAVELACFAGLLLDIVYGGILGKHAIAFGLSIYLLFGLRTRLQHSSMYHEMVLVFLLTVLSQILLYSVNTLAQKSVSGLWIICPALTTALTWPVVSQILDKLVAPSPEM